MKNLFLLLSILTLVSSCANDKYEGLVLNGTIENLKVGTVYLQKINKGTMVNLDSITLDGTGSFTLKTALDEPQLLYVYLQKKDASDYNDRIAFFATDTIMTLKTDLYDFEKNAVISGGLNQALYTTFNKNAVRLNEVYTDLVKRELALQANENASATDYDELGKAYDAYLRKKVLYTVNFANTNKNSAFAAYLLLEEAENANPKLIDSVFKMMPKKIQTSLYGKELSEFLKDSKY